MRIGIAASIFPPEIGGVQSYSCHMACVLAELGRCHGVHPSKRLQPVQFGQLLPRAVTAAAPPL
jgi:hypothetical protein